MKRFSLIFRSHLSEGSRRSLSRRHARLFVALTLAVLPACGGTPPQGGAVMAAPPPEITAVGPIPGPEGDPPGMANPFASDRTAIGEGRKLFVNFNCSGCHGGRAGGGMGPSLRDEDWLYGNRDAQIFSSIAEGRAHGMPSWHKQLTPDQTWKLVAYIKSLRTRNEPQAPPTE
jgi:cytochrome c oxidase cbb3-type subunit 3